MFYDVMISGAGPVGLFLACELALAKCTVLVLEKAEHPHSPLKQLPFGIRGLSAPTVEAFYRRGVLKELMVPQRLKDPFGNTAKAQSRRQAGHFAGIPFYFDDIDTSQWAHRLPSSTDTMLLSEMEELETVLARRAQALGVVIKRGVAATGLHQTGDGVRVESDGQSFQGKWLVGCDGSRSVVRKMGGFEFAGTEPEFTGYSAQVEIADPEKLSPGRNLTATGMYFQSQPGFLVMQEFDGGASHGAGPVTLAQVQQVLRRVSGTDVTVSALHVAATWTDRARQATSYRNGRVLLAGDAAHIHAPLGGQGLNLGIGDAMNLGWKLAAAIHGHAPAGLLDSYHTERHPVGAQVLDWSRAQVAAMRPDPHARALSAILRDLMETRDGATYFAGRVRGVFMQYDLGGGHPLVGCSVPNFELEDGTTIGELMHDGRGMLLDFVSNAALKTLAAEYGDRMKYVAGRAKDQCGLSAALIRPDGFVVWASGQQPHLADAGRTAARWFSANPR
ncbi:FAD-dependent monooxygenase [Duganella sp. LjRoot269]|jgi:2-polyprenyl-6-methoxyphenol hydroxylase-like FAD-dependent oxidoreductase|uniref:FAD-dependent monooxygenase n=1 Tax=Duganella sp. LjRoot269 TaxID=3342305 RepID=UPI003ECC56DC